MSQFTNVLNVERTLYIFTQTLRHRRDSIQDKILNQFWLVLIRKFPSPRLVAKLKFEKPSLPSYLHLAEEGELLD